MRTSTRSNPFFDTRSVLLFAAIAAGGVMASQARAADNAAPRSAASVIAQSATTTNAARPAPTAAANPANQPPAMSQKNDVPPMTTSPAFGPGNQADKHTGAANNPDKRPEIEATRPASAAKLDADRKAKAKAMSAQPAGAK